MTEAVNLEIIILNRALELPPFERPSYLDQACSGNASLRRQVEDLLRAHEDAGDFLENTQPCRPRDTFDRVLISSERPGDRIGRYTLLSLIGEGGCGAVYLTEQHEPVRRRVALKVIKVGMDTRRVIARFEAERQALALMDHPNIAKVFDAGTTERGRPYFVMEYVLGEKITAFCDANRFSIRQRLELFVQVCLAIQHAHQKGIIHRDIKPSNVLVTTTDGEAVPKIIDFGIAKATQGRLIDRTALTVSEPFIGTPAYMSPEQAAASADVDTRSDIYSLGVLLYELLADEPPFDKQRLTAASFNEMCRIIGEEEPVKPSLKVRCAIGNSTATRLRGDLDCIVMKCLEKERSRRYPTAHDLAADIRRHLNAEPISARAPSAAYRFGKLIQRNKLAFATVSIVAIAITALAIGATVAAWRVAGARRAEQASREKAERATEEYRHAVHLLEFDRAEDFFQGHDATRGVAQLAALLRKDPSNTLAANRLVSALTQRSWAVPLSPPSQHLAPAIMVSFSPDGRTVLSASSDGTARLIDSTTGTILNTLRHGSRITAARFNPSGTHIVTSSFDQTAQVWSTNGERSMSPLRHSGPVYWAEFSPNEQLLVTASGDKSARIWNATTGELRHELRRHSSDVVIAHFSPDGRDVVTGGSHGSIRFWDVASGAMLFQVEDRKRPLTALTYSPDGSKIMVACEDGMIRLWDAQTGAMVGEPLVHSKPVWHAAFSPDGRWIVTACEDGMARIWNAATTRTHGEPLRHSSGVVFAAFSPNSDKVITGSSDNSARVWDVSTGAPLYQPLRHLERVLYASFAPGGDRISTASRDGAVAIWQVHAPLTSAVRVNHAGSVMPLAITRDGNTLLTVHARSARISDASTGQLLVEKQSSSIFTAGAFSPNGQRAAIGCSDGSIRILAIAGHAPEFSVGAKDRHRKSIRTLRFSSDGACLLSASSDGTARVWDALSGMAMSPPMRHKADVLVAQFSSDDRFVVTASEDRTARVWNSQSGQPATEPLQHFDHVQWGEFSPDGKVLVTASTDNTACLWDVPSGKRRMTLKHGRIVLRAVFSLDGRRVATASIDGTACVWDAETGQAITPSLSHDSWVERVCFSNDGMRLFTVSHHGAARMWDIRTGRPLTEWSQAHGLLNAVFAASSERFAVGSTNGFASVWTFNPAPTPVPTWFPAFAEAAAGLKLSERGSLEIVDPSTMARLASEHSGGKTFYERLAHDFVGR